jgi:hypothetical protein
VDGGECPTHLRRQCAARIGETRFAHDAPADGLAVQTAHHEGRPASQIRQIGMRLRRRHASAVGEFDHREFVGPAERGREHAPAKIPPHDQRERGVRC